MVMSDWYTEVNDLYDSKGLSIDIGSGGGGEVSVYKCTNDL